MAKKRLSALVPAYRAAWRLAGCKTNRGPVRGLAGTSPARGLTGTMVLTRLPSILPNARRARYDGRMQPSFAARLRLALATSGGLLCVGLDPDLARLPSEF